MQFELNCLAQEVIKLHLTCMFFYAASPQYEIKQQQPSYLTVHSASKLPKTHKYFAKLASSSGWKDQMEWGGKAQWNQIFDW